MDNKIIALETVSEAWIVKNIVIHDSKIYSFFKNCIDTFFGLVGFFIFLIFLPIISLLIKIDSKGNVLFFQERMGRNKKKFFLYKFRTMVTEKQGSDEVWREKNRNNITFIGKLLRRTHLDELPQAINILRGEISFVGPRAEWSKLANEFEQQIPFYTYRYLVKPGIIGWAQINFPPSQSLEEAKKKFEFDLYYIKNRSILLDLEIMVKSFKLFRW